MRIGSRPTDIQASTVRVARRIIEKLKDDMHSSPVEDITFISRPNLEILEAAVEDDFGFAEGYEAGSQDVRKLLSKIERLRKSAALLLQHTEFSFEGEETPQWLEDCRNEIEKSGRPCL
jgi:hypothetical protein